MRKRMKGVLVYRAIGIKGTQFKQAVTEPAVLKTPFVRIFGKWFPIREDELTLYKGFNIEYR